MKLILRNLVIKFRLIQFPDELKLEFDNNYNETVNIIKLGEACVVIWKGLRENHILMIRLVIEYIIAILLESKIFDNKE